MAVVMTPMTSRIMPTTLVLFLTANVIGMSAMYINSDKPKPATNGGVSAITSHHQTIIFFVLA
jgi:hypothetical protein